MRLMSVGLAFHSDVTSNGVDARLPRNAVASVQVRYRLHAQWGDSHVTAHLRLAAYRRCSPALVLINGDTYPRPKSSVALTRVTNLSGQCLKSRWVAGLYHTVLSAESLSPPARALADRAVPHEPTTRGSLRATELDQGTGQASPGSRGLRRFEM